MVERLRILFFFLHSRRIRRVNCLPVPVLPSHGRNRIDFFLRKCWMRLDVGIFYPWSHAGRRPVRFLLAGNGIKDTAATITNFQEKTEKRIKDQRPQQSKPQKIPRKIRCPTIQKSVFLWFWHMLLLCLTKFNQRFLPQLGVFAQKNSPTFNKPRLVLLQFGVTKPGWYGGKIPTKRERATRWVSHLSWRTMAHGFNGRCWKQCEKTRDLKEKIQRERINDRHDQTSTKQFGSEEEVCANISLFQENLNRCSMLRCVQFTSKCRDECESLPAIWFNCLIVCKTYI